MSKTTHIPVKKAANKILKVYYAADSEAHAVGMVWYEEAHQFCLGLSSKYAVDLSKVVGILSALSPGCTWDQNKKDTISALEHFIHGTPIKVSTYGQFVLKARRIFGGEDVPTVLNGPKITAFYFNILRPECDEHVCVDRHAFKVARGIGKAGAVALTKKQMRDTQEAYKIAAHQVGLRPNQLQAITWITYKKIYNR